MDPLKTTETLILPKEPVSPNEPVSPGTRTTLLIMRLKDWILRRKQKALEAELPTTLEKQAAFAYNTLSPADRQSLFEAFKKAYEENTGAAWNQRHFESRAGNWKFYGTPRGGVAVRPQRSGFTKLTAAYGSPKDVVRGIRELQTEGPALWGAVSEELVPMAERYGMIAPHRSMVGRAFLKRMLSMIPDQRMTMQQDGSLLFQDASLPKAVRKFAVVSPKYLETLAGKSHVPGLSLAVRMMMKMRGK